MPRHAAGSRKNNLDAWFKWVTADAEITTLEHPTGDGPVGSVYTIHLESPFGHAHHYTGWSSKLAGRLWHHYNGTGAHFMKLVKLASIEWHVSRIDYNATRQDERRCKNRGGASRRCLTAQGTPQPFQQVRCRSIRPSPRLYGKVWERPHELA